MHVLTKLFIVLVSLLAVFLVPLVVVYSHNEDSYKAKFEQADAQAASANASLSTLQVAHEQTKNQLNAEIQRLDSENKNLLKTLEERAAAIAKLEADLIKATAGQSEIQAKLATLATAVDSSQKLISSLIDEAKTLRSDTLTAQQQRTAAEEAANDFRAQLDVAVAARRALEEEVERLKNERAQALDTIMKLAGKYGVDPGKLFGDRIAAGMAPPVSINATILKVERNDAQTLVELNVGSRDGVKVGWVMTISRSGTYLGKLQVSEVDIDHCVGVVDPKVSDVKDIRANDEAIAIAGRN